VQEKHRRPARISRQSCGTIYIHVQRYAAIGAVHQPLGHLDFFHSRRTVDHWRFQHLAELLLLLLRHLLPQRDTATEKNSKPKGSSHLAIIQAMLAEPNHAKLKCLRFGPFRFHPATGELQRNGVRIPLQDTPARLLAELTANPEVLCTREELCARLWPEEVYLDFENNLNNAVARLRQALEPGSAQYIETIRRRGYRFIAPITHSIPPAPPVSLAHQALRKGWHFRNRTTVRDLWRAMGYFEQAIRDEPHCAEAHAALSDTYVLIGDDVVGGLRAADALPRAETAARLALQLDPSSAIAQTTLAMVDWRLRLDWKTAEERFQQSIDLDPGYATTWQYYSWLLEASGRAQEGRDAVMRALQLAPASPFVSANVGWMLYLDRRHNQALTHLQETLELDENYALAHLTLGFALQQAGSLPEALAHFRFGLVRAGDSYYRAAYAQALGRAGFQDKASAQLQAPDVTAYHCAMIHASLGQEEDTLHSLESAVADHSSALPYLDVDPLFGQVRTNRRFKTISQSPAFCKLLTTSRERMCLFKRAVGICRGLAKRYPTRTENARGFRVSP
jgi:DNA-binding winged helix-turn-helix (wHTH) protein/Tfp pilus assembly protein PilF